MSSESRKFSSDLKKTVFYTEIVFSRKAQKQLDNQSSSVFSKFTLSFFLFSCISLIAQQSERKEEKRTFVVSKGLQ